MGIGEIEGMLTTNVQWGRNTVKALFVTFHRLAIGTTRENLKPFSL
jgi:hypothetical protein